MPGRQLPRSCFSSELGNGNSVFYFRLRPFLHLSLVSGTVSSRGGALLAALPSASLLPKESASWGLEQQAKPRSLLLELDLEGIARGLGVAQKHVRVGLQEYGVVHARVAWRWRGGATAAVTARPSAAAPPAQDETPLARRPIRKETKRKRFASQPPARRLPPLPAPWQAHRQPWSAS